MQLQYPLAAIAGGVEGDMLAILVRASEVRMDAAMIARSSGKSYTGVRHALRRLVLQGVVLEEIVGARSLYRFNQDHILASAIAEIVDVKARLFAEVTRLLTAVGERPEFAAVFGSASRDEMSPASDIDLFVLRPDGADVERFEVEVTAVTERLSRMTGNDVRALIYSASEAKGGPDRHPVLGEVARDGVVIVGSMAEFRRLWK
ncbi:nucleotidyltransferase domain-containing protein [Microbacterium sp. A84]|uniref:nucleotidyltransferase domain-containing protein n=1 Tax=Microbacterium sp. A84 TaxID=3450715 RepID=UPI003F42A991